MREHAGARRELHLRARARPLRRQARGAQPRGARRARPPGPRAAAGPHPAARQQPARARLAHGGRARRPAGAARAAARVRRGPVRLLAALGPVPRRARRGGAGAGRQAPAARLHGGRRGARPAGARHLPRRRREHHRQAAARAAPGRGRRRGRRVRRAPQVAGAGSLPRAAHRHPLRPRPAPVPAAAARPADEHAHRASSPRRRTTRWTGSSWSARTGSATRPSWGGPPSSSTSTAASWGWG